MRSNLVIIALITIAIVFAGCQKENTARESDSAFQPTPTQHVGQIEKINQTLPEYGDISSNLAEIEQLLQELEELDTVSFEI